MKTLEEKLKEIKSEVQARLAEHEYTTTEYDTLLHQQLKKQEMYTPDNESANRSLLFRLSMESHAFGIKTLKGLHDYYHFVDKTQLSPEATADIEAHDSLLQGAKTYLLEKSKERLLYEDEFDHELSGYIGNTLKVRGSEVERLASSLSMELWDIPKQKRPSPCGSYNLEELSQAIKSLHK